MIQGSLRRVGIGKVAVFLFEKIFCKRCWHRNRNNLEFNHPVTVTVKLIHWRSIMAKFNNKTDALKNKKTGEVYDSFMYVVLNCEHIGKENLIRTYKQGRSPYCVDIPESNLEIKGEGD